MAYTKMILPLAAVAVLLAVFVPSARAIDGSDWPMILSVQEPLQVSGLLLSPGAYIFQRYSGVSRTVVMIYSLDKNRWEGMVFGFPASRTGMAENSAFEISRTAPGMPEELRFWFYQGWQTGIEFPVTSRGSSTTALMRSSAPVQTAYISK